MSIISNRKLFSFVIFALYSLLITISTYVGDPIDCLSNKNLEDEMGKFIDWFCYIHGTSSLKWPRKGEIDGDGETIGRLDCYDVDKNEKCVVRNICNVLIFHACTLFIRMSKPMSPTCGYRCWF